MVGVRRKRVDADVARFLFKLTYGYLDLPDKRDPWLIWNRVFNVAAEHQLTMYDASYSESAMERRSTFAAPDHALVRAAKQAKVEVVQP